MSKKYLILLSLSGLIICLDQLTKALVQTQFALGESISVISGFFNLTYVRNFGAAFGIFADLPPIAREMFFLSMPPIAILIILAILRGVHEKDWWQILALSSVFAGAIGNYIDRLRFRYVIDFLDFHYKEIYSWPAFNVADMAIVGGVMLLLLLMSLESRQKVKNEK